MDEDKVPQFTYEKCKATTKHRLLREHCGIWFAVLKYFVQLCVTTTIIIITNTATNTSLNYLHCWNEWQSTGGFHLTLMNIANVCMCVEYLYAILSSICYGMCSTHRSCFPSTSDTVTDDDDAADV